ncbi:conserved hypothetical protein [Nostocoides japonicum T1-X7]|uniref:PAC2 family protein n=1 Tax=Nostocoides japonicum T1-X7 TaxID=1194083 RepID=A0A077M159_9MICO|nr:PAC2 family protein [Tetrasphaera japonica]CCH80073.1 conserved hypothetical protein [Tetrasphaera japonica T1-X7]
MLNPSDLYRFEVDGAPERRPGALFVALGGFMDAGAIQRILATHLLQTSDAQVVASFDVDQVLDYRGRRPPMVFDGDHWASYDDPAMLLHRLTDRDGTTYYILEGPEPDYQWERMVEAVREVIRVLGISLVVTTHGIPMGVPHTRPVGFTAHGTDRSLLGGRESPFGRVEVPGSFAALLELRLGEAGQQAVGFAVHVPHYLAQGHFAEGALAALNAVAGVTGLNLPNDELVRLAGEGRAAIDEAVAGSDEVRQVVGALEEQYDAFVEGQRRQSLLATESGSLPSADEIGAEFEQFLRSVTGEDDGPQA